MELKNIRVLVVDDEESLRESVRDYLELEGYEVRTAESAEAALRTGLHDFDVMLLDVMMEGKSGFELARQLKEEPSTAALPIIFLTALDSDADMVSGLQLGADDYISKPFSMRNLMARIDAVMRRVRGSGVKQAHGVVCDRRTLTCCVDGAEVMLPRKEFELLALMLDKRGRIFTRRELMQHIWPEKVVVTERTVDVHITRLRSKIAPYGKNIVSRSGYGYGWQD